MLRMKRRHMSSSTPPATATHCRLSLVCTQRVEMDVRKSTGRARLNETPDTTHSIMVEIALGM